MDLITGVSPRDLRRRVRPLEGLGCEHRGKAGVEGRIFFRRGNPPAYHLNLAVFGGGFRGDHLLFRDALRADPETAREHARLKHELTVRFREDRGAYTGGRTRFVGAVLRRAGPRRG